MYTEDGKELAVYMIQNDLTMADLAEKLGVSRQSISYWLHGQRKFPKWLKEFLNANKKQK